MYGTHHYDTSGNDANCWVYILQAKDRRRMVKYTLDIRRELDSASPGSLVVFCRGFGDIVDGIAFKVFLQNLSSGSLERIISMTAPMRKDKSYKPKNNHF